MSTRLKKERRHDPRVIYDVPTVGVLMIAREAEKVVRCRLAAMVGCETHHASQHLRD